MASAKSNNTNPTVLSRQLLKWFDANRRDLAWRTAPGVARDPYRVWLSEVMLQQTQVVSVTPYYLKFLKNWPNVHKLASADDDAVMVAWAGLGYYARARNLLKCARQVSLELDGVFPDSEAGLLALPGIGPYSAAAIAAIAFGRKAAAVDGNVVRVVARLDGLDRPPAKLKAKVGARVMGMVPKARPGDFAEACMELGATVCRARNPACDICPWLKSCHAGASATPEMWPVRSPKTPKPHRKGWVFWVERDGGDGGEGVLLVRRPPKGLLGGMMGFPTTEWSTQAGTQSRNDEGLRLASQTLPKAGDWQVLEARIKHTFTHFHLELGVVRGRWAGAWRADEVPGGDWYRANELEKQALPSVMRKVFAVAQKQG